MHIDVYEKIRLLRDKPLRFDWKPAHHDEMLERLHETFDFEIANRQLRKDALCGLVIAGVKNSLQGHFTSYSRSSDFYKGKNDLFGCPHFTRSHIKGAFKDTEHCGMFINIIAPQGSCKNPSKLYKPQSVFMATLELIEAMRDIECIYKHRKPVIVKDLNGMLTAIPETAFSAQRRKDMDELNEFYGTSLRVSFDESYKQYGSVYKIGSDWEETRSFQVYSSFCHSSWEKGGRLYHWVENMRKVVRSEILINGERTVELDYKMMQPTMLFAEMGIQLSRDVYELGHAYGLGEASRDLHKRAFAAALNGSSVSGAAHSIMEKSPPQWKLNHKQANETVQRFLDKTPEIRDLFFKDRGLSLQRKDSEIVVSVLKQLIRDGIPAISIHDSLIVPERYSHHVSDVMTDTFSKFFPTYKIEVR